MIHQDELGNKYYAGDVLPKNHTWYIEATRKIQTEVSWDDGTKSLISQYCRLTPRVGCLRRFQDIIAEATKEAGEIIDNACKQSDTNPSNILERIAPEPFALHKDYVWNRKPTIQEIDS